MRLIIQSDYQSVSKWAAHYVAAKIKAAHPTPEKPVCIGMPHRFFSVGHVQGTYRPEQERHRVFPERSDFQYGRVCRFAQGTSRKLLFLYVEQLLQPYRHQTGEHEHF